MKQVLMVFAVVVLGGCSRPTDPAEQVKAIKETFAQFAVAFKNEDIQTIETLMSPTGNFSAFTTRSPGLMNWGGVKNEWEHIFEIYDVKEFRFDPVHVLIAGQNALAYATFRASYELPDGTTILISGRDTSYLEYRDGKWLNVHMHISFTPGLGTAQ